MILAVKRRECAVVQDDLRCARTLLTLKVGTSRCDVPAREAGGTLLTKQN